MRRGHAAVAALAVVCALLQARSASAQRIEPSELPVTVGRAEIESSGFVTIVGEIRNASTVWACSPSVDVELFDATGKPLTIASIVTVTRQERGKAGVDGAVAARTIVPPGEIAVFSYIRDVKKIGGTYASHRVTARARRCPTQPKVLLEGFVAKKRDDGWYSASGVIRNLGPEACHSPKAVIACYRADGRLERVEDDQPDEMFQKQLQAGRSVPFNVKSIENPGNAIAAVKAWADCELPH